MAAIDGVPTDMIWVHVSLSHARASEFLAGAELAHRGRIPRALLSVNRNTANTQALVKIAMSEADLRNLLPNIVEGAILRVFTEADRSQAVSMVNGW